MDSPIEIVSARTWTNDIMAAWLEAVTKHTRRVELDPAKKSWMNLIEPEVVFCWPLENPDNAVFVDGYIILFNVGIPWYSSKARVLDEQLVVNVSESKHGFRSVIKALHELARRYECKIIHVGDAFTLDSRLSKVYQGAGFKPEAQSLIKEL